MALPALRLLAASGCAPALAGKAWADDLFSGHGWPFRAISGRLFSDIACVRALTREVGAARRGVLLPNSFGAALLFRASGIRSAGLATDGRGWLLDTSIPEPPRMHEVERFWRVAQGALAAWGMAPAFGDVPRDLGLELAAHHREAADRLLSEHKVPATFALLAPIATGLHHGRIKHWSQFAELIEPLRARGIEPVAMPPANENAASRAALPGAMILPPAPLGTYAALGRRATVVIANDSGISHVAAAVGARQVTIFGVTEPDRTGPWNPRAVPVGCSGAWPAPAAVLAAIDRALTL
jgi:heptosyltransferase II